MRTKLITSSLNNMQREQHTAPCSDCPWRRDSLPGWLGEHTPTEFVEMAHGEVKYHCHVIVNQQCAGMAQYRRNVAKQCRDNTILRLPDRDTTTVFAHPAEFLEHHKKGF